MCNRKECVPIASPKSNDALHFSLDGLNKGEMNVGDNTVNEITSYV